eukprot:gene16790-23067_t
MRELSLAPGSSHLRVGPANWGGRRQGPRAEVAAASCRLSAPSRVSKRVRRAASGASVPTLPPVAFPHFRRFRSTWRPLPYSSPSNSTIVPDQLIATAS